MSVNLEIRPGEVWTWERFVSEAPPNSEAEGLSTSAGWGGSDTIGGSPRPTGSALSPEKVMEIINRTLTEGSR